MMLLEKGSFRDPSGRVFYASGEVFRTINRTYREEWEFAESSGLLAAAEGLLVPFADAQASAEVPLDESVWKLLAVKRLPFISYPYEWSFSQLKDAALLTLELHRLALEHGCILKDASAFNVQFFGGKPLFIDLLSFERWKEGQPWQAYGQFCSHFLAPLALMAKVDIRFGQLSRQWIDGIPLDLACKLLPKTSKLSPGLGMHLFLHASMQKKYEDGRIAANKVSSASLSMQRMLDVAESLKHTVEKLHLPKQQTEWSEYYTDTNYTEAGYADKQKAVSRVAAEHPGEVAVDIGANTGEFTKLLMPHFSTVIGSDFDPLAVERLYTEKREEMLPLVLDIASPTPALGWAGEERKSFTDRCRVDFLMALAVCHHLRFTCGIPLDMVAQYFSRLLNGGGTAIIEFVPKEDSQVQRLLAARDDVFDDYSSENFEAALIASGFSTLEKCPMADSLRTLYVVRKG